MTRIVPPDQRDQIRDLRRRIELLERRQNTTTTTTEDQIHDGEGTDSTTLHPSTAVADAQGDGSIAIGAGPTAGGDNAIAAGTGADAHNDDSVAVGPGSYAGLEGVAIGKDAEAWDYCVVLGSGASVADGTSELCVVIGPSATVAAASDSVVCIGHGASVDGNDSMALGKLASATAAQAVAIAGAAGNPGSVAIAGTTDDDNQFMLGTDGHTVVVPGTFILQSPDTSRWAVTVSNAGVLSVAPA